MKIEYGRALDGFKQWFKRLIFKAGHHDEWMADGYGYLAEQIESYAKPLVESIEQKHERLWDENNTRYVNHQVEDQVLIEKNKYKRDYIDEEIKKELGIPFTIHKRHRPKLGVEIPTARGRLKGYDPLFTEDDKEKNEHKDS